MTIQRIVCILGLIFLLSAHSKAYTEKNLLQQSANPEQVKPALVTNQKWVPYPDYPDRAGWDKLLNENKALLIERAEKALPHPWEVVKATDYIEFERSGNRTVMEAPFGRNNEAIAALLLGELAEGKGRFIDQLINGVFHSCEMTSWVLSAHLSAQHSKRSLPDAKEHVIDLTAGDLGALLAWVYYFFHAEFDKVNPLISERLRTELQTRILDTYMQEDRFWWMAFNLEPGELVNNWNPWCNFNVLQCFLLLEDDRDKLAEAVYRTMLSVDKFINYTHIDGGCEEGPSYWGHAAGKMYDYLQLLSDGTDGKVSVFNHPMIRNMGEYIVRSYVGNGWVVNFADASARGGGDAPLIYRYGKAVDSDRMVQHAALMNQKNGRKLSFGRDVFRTLQSLLYAPELNALQGAPQSPSYSWYPETEFCYMANTNGFFVAAKGGNNNESHNHNDIGTFSLYLNTVPVFIDAGVGTYTRQTFSSERYTIWTMQSNYHNLPMINGAPQKFGPEYKSADVKFDPKRMSFSVNIANAYPGEAAVKTWTRTYSLGKDELKITDKFELEKASQPNTVNFLAWGDVNVSEAGKVEVTVQGGKAVLSYDKDTFEASKETIALDDPRLSGVWGATIYRISLKAKKTEVKGLYSYTIKRMKTDFVSENVSFAQAQIGKEIAHIEQSGKALNPVTLQKDGSVYYCSYTDWRSGFFPGTVWYLYELTGDKTLLPMARKYTGAIEEAKKLSWHHDVGFIIETAFGNALRLTNDKRYKEAIIEAAQALSTRFREKPGTIQSWNVDEGWQSERGWECPVIIDNMMNLELLFHATKLTGDSTFYKIAKSHADRTMREQFRPDGSCYHVIDYSLATGEVRNRHTAQGYAHESAWSRGQAWAIYGYTMCYRETGDRNYLNTAVKTFNFLKNHPDMPDDLIPYWDMDAPEIPNELRDASAAACIAAALYELSTMDVADASSYRAYADKIMTSLSSPAYRAGLGENGHFILMHSVGSIPHDAEIDVPLNYADYYFMEALKRKKDMEK